MKDFFVPQEPSQKLAQIERNRNELMARITKGNKARNDVALIGTYRSATKQSVFDEFRVVTQGTSDATADDLRFFTSLGCTVSSHHGRIVILHCDHSSYDKRLIKLDMSTAQIAIVAALLLVAFFLAAVGFSL